MNFIYTPSSRPDHGEHNSRLRLWCPIPCENNPFADLIEERTTAWIYHQGLGNDAEHRDQLAQRSSIGQCASRWYPDSEVDLAQIGADFLALTFALDDFIDLPHKSGDNVSRIVRLARFTRPAEAPESPPLDDSPLGMALADIFGRLSQYATSVQLARFGEACRKMFVGLVWQNSLLADDLSHDLNEYAAMRMATVFGPCYTALAEILHGYQLDCDELTTPTVRALSEMSWWLTGWHNDIYAWAKEAASGAPDINAVAVIASHNGGYVEHAMAETVALANQVMALFLTLRAQTQRQASDPLRLYLQDLGRYISGCLEYYKTSSRYREGIETRDAALLENIWLDNSEAQVDPDAPPSIPTIAWWWKLCSPMHLAIDATPSKGRTSRNDAEDY